MQNGIPEDHSMILLCLSDHSASQIDLANFRFQLCRFSETRLTDKKSGIQELCCIQYVFIDSLCIC